MKCPYCQAETMHGWLNSGRILWSERKHKISLLTDGKEKYALNLDNPVLTFHHTESYYCPSCKKLIIDTEGYDTNIE